MTGPDRMEILLFDAVCFINKEVKFYERGMI